MKKKLLLILFVLFSLLLFGCNDKKEYKVTFLDKDGNILKTEYLLEGSTLELINPPNVEGYDFDKWNVDSLIVSSDLIVYPIYKEIEKELPFYYDVYKVVFLANGGELLEGDEIQYVTSTDSIKYPKYYAYLKEFDHFDVDCNEETKTITYTAVYKDLNVLDISPNDWLNNINFGYNYVGFSNETDINHEELINFLFDNNINAITFPFQLASVVTSDYEHINRDVLDGIKEIVDIAYNKGMYIIIAPYDYYSYTWSSLNYRNHDRLLKIIDTSLKELANYFKDYNERLVFSFLVEPRDYDNNSITREAMWVLNDANEAYVKMVRSTGGNNLYRNIIITTGKSNATSTGYEYFRMVNDDHTIVRVNSYAPFEFTHEEDYVNAGWNEEKYQIELYNLFATLKINFLDKNIPVYIGEFGSRDKHNEDDRAKWLDTYLSLAHAFNIKLFTWDCHHLQQNNEFTFCLFDRTTLTWLFPALTNKLVDLIKNDNYTPYFLEMENKVHYIDDEIVIPSIMTNIKTGEKVNVKVNYDQDKLKEVDNKLYAKDIGDILFSFEYNNHVYYYKYTVLPVWEKYQTSFKLEIRENNEGITQCYIITEKTKPYQATRVSYDWYSTDTSILTINKYSSISIHSDGVCAIIAIHKETGDYGVIKVVIKDIQIVSFESVVTITPPAIME